MTGTQFQIESGTGLLHVPCKGSALLTTNLLGGQLDLSFDTMTPVLPFIKKGKLLAAACFVVQWSPCCVPSGINLWARS